MPQRDLTPPGHIIHMSIAEIGGKVCSLAVCDCGWRNAIRFGGHHKSQDEACAIHWHEADTPPGKSRTSDCK